MPGLSAVLERLNAQFAFAVFTHTKHRAFVHFYGEQYSYYYYAQGFDVGASKNELLFPQQADRAAMSEFIRKYGELVDQLIDYPKHMLIKLRDQKFAAFAAKLIAHCLALDDIGQSPFQAQERDTQATLEVHDEFCTLWREEREDNERREKRKANMENG